MSDPNMARAARRLKLPQPSRMSVSEAEEARLCEGCIAIYDGGMRVVHAIPGCPAHSDSAAARPSYDPDEREPVLCVFCEMDHPSGTACPSCDSPSDAMVLPGTWR